MQYHIYTDGACSRNPGPGGWCAIVTDGKDNLINIFSDYSDNTTNNREEIKPILFVMERYGDQPIVPIVYTDSGYCYNTFTNWMFIWARNGWTKKTAGVIKNLDLIKEYYELFTMNYRIQLRQIRGHTNIFWNEIADQVAKGKLDKEEVRKQYGRTN